MDRNAVLKRVEELLEEEPYFLVDVVVDAKNNIRIEIDSETGVNTTDCLKISRGVEGYFDREVEDYGLEVSSPGLDKPFKVWQQYEKNVGRNVRVVKTDGIEVIGELLKAADGQVELQTKRKEKVEGKKKKVLVTEVNTIALDDIKTAQIKLKF